jgi:lipid-binding SYLF domain-containing protein
MTKQRRLERSTVAALALAAILASAGAVVAADSATIDRDAAAALQSLYRTTPGAKALGAKAKGILIFPKIRKAGFMVGGQFGNGTLLQNGKEVGRYNITAGSYGLQAGVQSFSYAMFFMTDSALEYLDRSGGFEVGTGPSVVLVDEGMAKTLTTTTTRSDVYAFIFGQRGLMGGLGLQGSKITKISQ